MLEGRLWEILMNNFKCILIIGYFNFHAYFIVTLNQIFLGDFDDILLRVGVRFRRLFSVSNL